MSDAIIDIELFSDVFAGILGDSIRDGVPARLGKPTTGEVEIDMSTADLPGSVYIHGIGSNGGIPSNPQNVDDTSVSTALLLPNKIPPGLLVYNCPVIVVKRDGYYYVEDLDGIRAIEFLFGLKDRVQRSIDIGQIDYGMTRPSSPASFRVLVSRARYDFDNTIYDVPALLTDDLSSYVPGTGLARAIRIDVRVSDKTLVLTSGTTFPATLSHEDAFLTYYPHVVPDGQFTSSWVKVYSGQVAIQLIDIYPGQELYTKRTTPLTRAQMLGSIVTDGGEVVVNDGEVVWVS